MEVEAATLQARMNHPAFVVPGAFDALQALSKAITTPASRRSFSS